MRLPRRAATRSCGATAHRGSPFVVRLPARWNGQLAPPQASGPTGTLAATGASRVLPVLACSCSQPSSCVAAATP